VLGVLVVAHTTAGEIEEATEAILLITKVLLFVLAIALIFAWLLSGKVLAPLRALATTARQISESDLTQRIPNSGKGELGELAQTFNEMMDRLEKSFTTQKDLLNDVGHELRTPITIIQRHLELMGDDPEEQHETLDLVFDELQRMTRLVNDLLLLAKTERSDFLTRTALDLEVFSLELFTKVTGMASRQWSLTTEARGSFCGDR
jgi:signal transduction histidine kinase